MAFSFWTLCGLLIVCVSVCVSSLSHEDARDVTDQSRDDVYDADDDSDNDDFGMGRELASMQKELLKGKQRFHQLWRNLKEQQSDEEQQQMLTAFNQSIQSFKNETHQLRVSLSHHLRSLNSFMTCLNSCAMAHMNDYDLVSEGTIRYFCNKSCLMALEQHHVLTSIDDRQTTTPDPRYVGLVG